MRPESTATEILFQMRPEALYRQCLIRLEECQRIDFLFSNEENPYYVESYKFLFLSSRNVYLCLDPYDERDASPNDKDEDVIIAKKVSVFAF